MNDEKISEINSFVVNLEKNKKFEISTEDVNKLIDNGFSDVTIKIFASSKKAAINLGINKALFENIQNVQSLPDFAIYNFLKSKGKLFDNNIINKSFEK